MEPNYEVWITKYGFRWGDVLIERTCSSNKKPKFQVLTIWSPSGEGVEITMTPRTIRTKTFKREKKK